MANTEILQEYLIKLGYKTDFLSLRRFEDSLGGTTKNLLKAGTAVSSIVAATGAATAAFAYSMRKMYFTSDLTKTSVNRLKSMEFATKQVGIESENMASILKKVSMDILYKPGTKTYIESLGVKTEGRETLDIVDDLIASFSKMDPFVGAQYAETILGMDKETFTLFVQNWDKYKKSLAEGDDIFARYRVSQAQNRKQNDEYTHSLDALGTRFEALETVIMGNPLIQSWFSEAVKKSGEALDSVAQIFMGQGEGGKEKSMAERWWDIFSGKEQLKDIKTFSERMEEASPKTTENLKNIKNTATTVGAAIKEKVGAGAEAVMDFFIKKGYSAEQAAGITANLQQESNFNPQAVGDKGKAVGLAQWHPDRQKEFKRVFGKDLKDATREEQLEFVHYELTQGSEKRAGAKLRQAKTRGEAAATISQFYERPADVEGEKKRRAAMAEKYAAPVGTQTAATMDIIGNTKLTGGLTAGANINTTNNFNITGTDAKSIGEAVVKKQVDVNENIARNLRVATR